MDPSAKSLALLAFCLGYLLPNSATAAEKIPLEVLPADHTVTTAHRTYGEGAHPHPGWDRKGNQVIFASHMLTDQAQVCIATIPTQWQEENPAHKRE